MTDLQVGQIFKDADTCIPRWLWYGRVVDPNYKYGVLWEHVRETTEGWKRSNIKQRPVHIPDKPWLRCSAKKCFFDGRFILLKDIIALEPDPIDVGAALRWSTPRYEAS